MDEPEDDFVPATGQVDAADWPGGDFGGDDWTEADEEALAQLDAGQFITHEAMMRWLESWGTENELPPPECGM